MRTNGDGEYAYTVGKYQVLLHLSAQLDVLALFHVELRRTPERSAG